MLEVRLLDDRNTWNSWVGAQPAGNILQSFEWGEFKSSLGWKTLRLAALKEGQVVAGGQVFLRHVPIGKIAYCPRGPVLDPANLGPAEQLLEVIHDVCRAEGAIFLKVEPPLLDSSPCHRMFTELGFRRGEGIQPRSTIVVDLSPDLDTIASRMNIKTRYNVGLASRKGIRIVEAGDEGAAVLYQMLLQTSIRAGFSIHAPEYYDKVWKLLRSRNMAQLLLATYGDEALSATMLFKMGQTAYYMYGASSGQRRNLKPSDLLQWESLKWAKSVGCTSYDMWGIPDEVSQVMAADRGADVGKIPEDSDKADGNVNGNGNGSHNGKNGSAGHGAKGSNSSLWGVYQFKRGFGGDVVRFAGAYDYVYSASRYLVWVRSVPLLRHLIGKVRQFDKSPSPL